MRSFLEDNYEQTEPDKKQQYAAEIAKVAGHVRALEAVLLEMSEVTPDRIRAAKENLRARFRNRNRHGRETAELLDLIEAPYDQEAEAVLAALSRSAENRPRGPAKSSKNPAVAKQAAPNQKRDRASPVCSKIGIKPPAAMKTKGANNVVYLKLR